MLQYARCNKCGAVYTDEESINMVKKWLAAPDKYAPCPNLSCDGQLEMVQSGCRLGWCAKKKTHYGGGWNKDIEEGRCPICKGQLEKQK